MLPSSLRKQTSATVKPQLTGVLLMYCIALGSDLSGFLPDSFCVRCLELQRRLFRYRRLRLARCITCQTENASTQQTGARASATTTAKRAGKRAQIVLNWPSWQSDLEEMILAHIQSRATDWTQAGCAQWHVGMAHRRCRRSRSPGCSTHPSAHPSRRRCRPATTISLNQQVTPTQGTSAWYQIFC